MVQLGWDMVVWGSAGQMGWGRPRKGGVGPGRALEVHGFWFGQSCLKVLLNNFERCGKIMDMRAASIFCFRVCSGTGRRRWRHRSPPGLRRGSPGRSRASRRGRPPQPPLQARRRPGRGPPGARPRSPPGEPPPPPRAPDHAPRGSPSSPSWTLTIPDSFQQNLFSSVGRNRE